MTILDDLLKTYGKEKLNAMTLYPPIYSFHKVDNSPKKKMNFVYGVMTRPYLPINTPLQATELIDGEGIKIIISEDDYFIGTKTEILQAKGDRIYNNRFMPIVVDLLEPFFHTLPIKLRRMVPLTFMKPAPYGKTKEYRKERNEANDRLQEFVMNDKEQKLIVIYAELYGYDIQTTKRYTQEEGKYGIRIFDCYEMNISEVKEMLRNKNVQELEEWAMGNNQPWLNIEELDMFCEDNHLLKVHPSIPVLYEKFLPRRPFDVIKKVMSKFTNTLCSLDDPSVPIPKNSRLLAVGKTAGLVVRDAYRKNIKVLRFNYYYSGHSLGFRKTKGSTSDLD